MVMSLATSRAVLRQSTFAVRRAGIRNASTTAEATKTVKDTASKAQSKASEGLTKVTSSASSAASSAGSAVSNASQQATGRVGRMVNFVQGLVPKATYYGKVGLELGKLIAHQRSMQPPSIQTMQNYIQPALNAMRNPSTLFNRVASEANSAAQSPTNVLAQVRNMPREQWYSMGVVVAEVIGFFSVGEIIGRFKLVGYRTNSPAQKLPSSGAAANPQLFGHGEAKKPSQTSSTSRKRKRGQNTVEAPPSPIALPAELDFFGGGAGKDMESSGDGLSKKQRKKLKKQEKQEQTEMENDADETEEVPYDVDECKRILRSHKLKIAVLEDFAPQAEEPPRTEKKPKKRKKEKEAKEKKKATNKTLYPRPLTSFAQLRTQYGISRRLAENIAEQGYKLPTEVQIGALPLLLANKGVRSKLNGAMQEAEGTSGAGYNGDIDLLTVAPTGSGKTIAFLIPIINALLSEGKPAHGQQGPRAIILAPTRELAAQIVNEARKLAKGTAIKATLMRKGMQVVEEADDENNNRVHSPEASENEHDESSSDDENNAEPKRKLKGQRAELVKAAILVATPLAVLNALRRKDGTVAKLTSLSQLVLDEADVLLDPLFREQTLALWNACVNPKLRIGLWSATMGSNIESLTTSTLNHRWTALSSAQSDLPPRPPLIRLVVGLKDSAIPNISHQLTYAATEQGKLLGLRQLLHPTSISDVSHQPTLRPPFLVFTQTIPRAIALHSELLYDIPPEAGGSSRIAVLHADLSSSARDSIMTRFRKGEIWVLITTDLLARGVDFRGLNGVVNYDVPSSAAGYVHRVGRTGRAGREGGVAVTFYTQEDIPYVKLIANVIRASENLRGVDADEGSVKQWLLDALPIPSKRDRQQLKKRGVEVRRTVKGKDAKGESRISSKSGYDRKIENMRKGKMEAMKRRERGGDGKSIGVTHSSDGESEFDGF
ncbi:atp-dependent rna helicase rok1 [Pyrenophora seminiperda CCB06]|uniref:ATP-dependent RNA helicase ROK1 n=1 Tax=Pyrenophora seminiperda CCB06 TaxID=1302712 RepID=A0A3M7LYT3_9PLEO|nr:atp-dependent rna helicase rok1 [Pyrenophora seminiperda CCB06]